MTRLRFSLLGLAGFVTAAAVGCAALIRASATIASAATTVLVVALSLSAVAALAGGPRRRGFWIGFAVCGWLYVLVIFGPLADSVGNTLLTTTLLYRASAVMPGSQPPPRQIKHVVTMPDDGSTELIGVDFTFVSPPDPASSGYALQFRQIGQVLCTLLLACLGGVMGQVLYARRNNADERK
jgi:hypothetical protein